MKAKLTLLSAYTGAGGMDIGLESAGFKSIGCIEHDQDARATIAANREGWQLLDPGDITQLASTISPEHLGLARGELDLLAGGPPCQPFSAAGQWTSSGRNGLGDPDRRHVLTSFFDLIRIFLPRAVLIENVPGFVRGPVSAAEWISQRLAAIESDAGVSYQILIRILNAADFGVPQKRTRGIVVLTRDDADFTWPEAAYRDKHMRAWDALRGFNIQDVPAPSGEWADLLESIPEGWNYHWHTDRGGGLPLFGYRTRYWSFLLKLAKDQPSWTLPAQAGPSTGPFHWDNRPLHIAEMAALQTFPTTWKFVGSERSTRRQIGNATPPLLTEQLGRALAASLGVQGPDERLVHLPSRSRKLPPARATGPVPERYLHLAGDHDPHPGEGKGPRPRNRADDQLTPQA